jgi:hypothetical protein
MGHNKRHPYEIFINYRFLDSHREKIMKKSVLAVTYMKQIRKRVKDNEAESAQNQDKT